MSPTRASPPPHRPSRGHPAPRSGSLPKPLRRDLVDILGRDGVITEADRLLAYESDALTYVRGRPSAVLFPRTGAELEAVVRRLAAAGRPWVPRGAGTGLTGGAAAPAGEVVVSTARMTRILALDPESRTATVEPGVTNARLNQAAAAHGLRYLPDPASAHACTLGGNVAQNSGGPHCLRHGVTSDHVLALEVVLPDGTPVALDRGEDGGLDLAGLFVGSEGTLGIVRRITVRLAPEARAVGTALALFDDVSAAGRAVSEILGSGAVPVAVEIVDRATIRIVEASPFAAGLPTEAAAALVMEFEGEPEEVESDLETGIRAARTAGATEVLTADDEAERARLWQARKRAYGALGRRAPEVMIQDAVVPRTALPGLLPRIEAIAERHGVELCNFFHAGDGNLHPNLLFDTRDPEGMEGVERANAEILQACVAAGGTITGEHGVGLDKKKAMGLIFSEAELDALRDLKAAVDPDGLSNPGKVLPDRTRTGAGAP